MLYYVKADEYLPYDGPKARKEIDALADVWKADKKPHHQVTTQHAAVNGMMNGFEKAVWLMGVHSQAAYPADQVREYTLVHNPSDGFLLDGVESAFDKRQGQKSHNAQQLAAVMQQCQQLGRRVKWTVHSQGAIICCAAIEELQRRGIRIPGQLLAIHGSGANLERLVNKAQAVGMQIVGVANNPFDLVPNLFGSVDRSPSGLRRSMKFFLITHVVQPCLYCMRIQPSSRGCSHGQEQGSVSEGSEHKRFYGEVRHGRAVRESSL